MKPLTKSLLSSSLKKEKKLMKKGLSTYYSTTATNFVEYICLIGHNVKYFVPKIFHVVEVVRPRYLNYKSNSSSNQSCIL